MKPWYVTFALAIAERLVFGSWWVMGIILTAALLMVAQHALGAWRHAKDERWNDVWINKNLREPQGKELKPIKTMREYFKGQWRKS